MSAIRDRVCARAIGHAFVLACTLLALGSIEAHAATVPEGFYGSTREQRC